MNFSWEENTDFSLIKLTQEASAHGLQHGQNGEEVQGSVNAFEPLRLPQSAGDLLHQQGPEKHHQHQAECVINKHDGVPAK